MKSKKSDEAKAKAERGKRIVARVLADKKFMAGVEEGRESQRQGKGVPFEEVQRAAKTNL